MASPLGLPFSPGVSGLPAKDGVKNYRVVDGKAVKSLFDSGQFSPYPETANVESGSVESIKGASDIHGDSTNDLSVTSIIKYTNDPTRKAMKLDYSHFAYLKKLGVYPNNRLIIARRFPGAVGNDLTTVGGSPMATIVSYLGEENDFLTVTFNEEWEEAAGGFEDILNDIGADVKLSMDQGTKVGSAVKAAFGVVPMPALMEGVQILVREKMGLNGAGQGPGASPYGNPNLIRQAMQRKVIPKGQAGSALTCKFSIDFEVEYEQKFINGVDPTLVYMDIIQNALTFGTSDATFEYSPAFASGATGLIKDLISGDIFAVGKAILAFTESLLNAIGSVITEIVEKIIRGDDDEDDTNVSDDPKERKRIEKEKENALIASTIAGIKEGFKITLGTVVSKYKLKLLGVANALTGSNSVPWHITIGNPKKPFFSSGDMLCESVTLTLGKVLAFNDLPSTIKLSIKMVSGRNLGAQEIFNRFNTGKGRSYKRLLQSVVELDDAVLQDDKKAEVNTKNNEKNNDTQQPPPQGQASADKTQTTGTTQTTGSQPPSQTIDKNQQTPNNQNNVIDPYTVDFSKEAGQLWGTKPVIPSGKQPLSEADQIAANIAAKKEKEERARQAEEEKAKQSSPVNNDPKTQASNQSTNDPNVVTSAVPVGSTTQNTQPNSSIPGVTQSTGVIQQQQAAGVTGSTPPQPESVPAPPLPEPEPRVSTEPEITIDKDGKTVLVYPPGVTPPDTTTAQQQSNAAAETAQTEAEQIKATMDSIKSTLTANEKEKAYYASQNIEDHKRMIEYYKEQIEELDRKIEFEKEDLLDPGLKNGAQELINKFESERNFIFAKLNRHEIELKNKSN